MSYLITNGIYSTIVDEVNVSPDEWVIVKSEAYRPDRSKFITDKFRSDFPKFGNTVDYDMIGKLASRSSFVSEWLSHVNLEYALNEKPPKYLEDIITPQEFSTVSVKLLQLSKNASSKASEELRASIEYKDKMKAIKDKYDRLSDTVKDSNIIKILSINSTNLPVTIQLSIENYTPTIGSSNASKETYAREQLVLYKISLLKFSNANPTVNMDDVISSLAGN